MNSWPLAIDAWVIQDGNYADFHRGQEVEVAVEFYGSDWSLSGSEASPTAASEGNGSYLLDGPVVAVVGSVWVIDCGILVYDEHPPAGVEVGDRVRGRALLSIDHFSYFERLAKLSEMPEMIYSWDVAGIREVTAPWVMDGDLDRVWRRDESQLRLIEIEATDAWSSDGAGHSRSYLLDCRLLDLPAKRTSCTAR